MTSDAPVTQTGPSPSLDLPSHPDDIRSLADTLPAQIFVIGADGRFRFANQRFATAVARPAATILGYTLADVLGPVAAANLESYGCQARSGEATAFSTWVTEPDGVRRFLHHVLALCPDPDGGLGFSVVAIDGTADRNADTALRLNEAIKAAAVNTTSDAVVAIDESGTIVDFNPAAAQMFGYARDRALGHRAADLIIPPELREDHLRGVRRVQTHNHTHILGKRVETLALRSDGNRLPVELIVTEVAVEGRRLFTATFRDLSERHSAEDRHLALAYHDPVTGLPNRLMLMRLLADDLIDQRPIVLVNIYIDRFTSIRNSFGHAFADELLIGLAGRMVGDVAPGDQLARVGDHVLALLMRGQRDDPLLLKRLDAIADILRSVVTPSGAAVFLSASMGVAAASRHHETPEDLLRDSEIATSRAREAGGSRVVWFDPSMHARVIDQVRTEHDLRNALDLGVGLWVAYQPIVEMVSEHVAGFEALVRWNHPERGQIPPIHFIPIAEETGLVVALGYWVLEAACRQIARWQMGRSPGMHPLFMSVNLSPRQLEEPGLIDTVRKVIDDTGINPKWLKLEITESAVMRRPEESIIVLRNLKDLGVSLSVDDFGTGYSSLSYLHKFPLDSIKVDRSFISALHLSEENRSIVRIIVDLARLLGLDVIAEGIESESDANLLRALACDFGQGFHYARPQAPDLIEPTLRGRPPWQQH